MACHIVFSKKYLRILEEFRKNPHIKIPPKSPCTNFPSLGKFNNPIFILKRFSLRISAYFFLGCHLAYLDQQACVLH
jgi:hypothetical protein